MGMGRRNEKKTLGRFWVRTKSRGEAMGIDVSYNESADNKRKMKEAELGMSKIEGCSMNSLQDFFLLNYLNNR